MSSDPLRVDPDGLADELKQWRAINWAIETVDGDDRKVPKRPDNPIRNARSNDGRELEQLQLLEEGKGLDLDGEPVEDVGGIDDVKGRVLTVYAPAHHTRIDVGEEVSDR